MEVKKVFRESDNYYFVYCINPYKRDSNYYMCYSSVNTIINDCLYDTPCNTFDNTSYKQVDVSEKESEHLKQCVEAKCFVKYVKPLPKELFPIF